MSMEDRARTREYYDELGDAEWDRFEVDLRGRVGLEVHRRFLVAHLEPGQRVLEVGAGPGRFTIELARLGARITVTDLSSVQLAANRARLAPTLEEAAVERRELLDVCDTSRYDEGEFDAVLAYGGPLSYAYEDIDRAVEGLLRVTRSGGVVIASVMSTLGNWRYFLPGVVHDATAAGEDAHDMVLRTGDLRPFGTRHVCQMYRSRELAALFVRHGGRVTAMSASNWTSLGDPEALAELEADPDRWTRFLDHEVAACAEPGATDGGTHILIAVVAP